jgi:hypothetical protein
MFDPQPELREYKRRLLEEESRRCQEREGHTLDCIRQTTWATTLRRSMDRLRIFVGGVVKRLRWLRDQGKSTEGGEQ